jgi:hypothetical protein
MAGPMQAELIQPLIQTLGNIAVLLGKCDEREWARVFEEQCANLIAGTSVEDSCRTMLRWFGGTGSFNDLILQNEHGVLVDANETLNRLNASLYAYLRQVISQENDEHFDQSK